MPDARNYSRPLGCEKVIEHFGYWPTFHDSELVSLMLDGDPGRGEFGPTAIITVRWFETERKITSADSGSKGCIITFAFYDIGKKKVEGRSSQSVTPGFSLVDLSGNVPRFSLAVKLQGVRGLACEFHCRLGEVIDFKPLALPATRHVESAAVAQRETSL